VAGLTSLAWRSLVARRLRSALTVVGIALGVGVLFASLAMDAGIERSIEQTVGGMVGRADLRVSAFTERGLSAASVSAIRNALSVDVAAPEIERRTYLRPDVGSPAGLPPSVTVLGIDPLVDADVHDLVIASGSPLERRDEAVAVISERLARDDGYELGSEVVLQGAGDPERFRIVGIAAGDGPLAGTTGRTVVIPIEAAARIFGLDGATRVDVRLAEGRTYAEAQRELAAALTADPYVLASPADLAASLRASTADFQSTTALIAAVALFVGAFLIFNTVSMTVVERFREVGLLRAAGATRRQVMRFVLAGASVLGLAGSLLGLLAGLGLTALMAAYLGRVGSVAISQIDAPPRAFAVALAVGFVVTLAAALEPAWRAGRIAPVAALRSRAEPVRGQRARLRWLVVVFVAVGVAGLLIWPRGGGDTELIRALAVYGLLLFVVLLSPFLLAPLGRLAGVPFAAVLRFEERLARSALVRDRSRTGLTVGALTMGLAMIVAIGGVAQNAHHAATAWLAGVIPGDEIVTSIRPVARGEGVLEALAKVDGVARVTPVATFDLALRGARVDAAAIVGEDFAADGRLRLVAGDRVVALGSLDGGGNAILPQSLAERLGLRLGDVLTFGMGRGGGVELRVAGIAERTLPGRAGETVLVGWADATSKFGVAGADFFGVRFAPGRESLARPALEAEARSLALESSTLDRVQGAVSDALARVFGLFDALALVAVLVAALGIFNTLTMNVIERVREIGVLRAAGMTRRQVGRMVAVEAGILGLLGAVLGASTGFVAATLMVVLAGGGVALPVDVPWSTIGLCLVLGVGLSMLAAWYPARLAARLSIVRAVQFE
jgi:putative ABC transport system permease protein